MRPREPEESWSIGHVVLVVSVRGVICSVESCVVGGRCLKEQKGRKGPALFIQGCD